MRAYLENAQNLTKTWSNLLGLGMIAAPIYFDKKHGRIIR